MHGIVSKQKIGANTPITQGFIRSLRNFMNNWETHGCSFKFDGYRAVLRVDQPAAVSGGRPHPWQPYNISGASASFRAALVNNEMPKIGSDDMQPSDPLTPPPQLTITTSGVVYCETPRSPTTGQPLSGGELKNAATCPATDADFVRFTIHFVRLDDGEITFIVGRSTSLNLSTTLDRLNIWRA